MKNIVVIGNGKIAIDCISIMKARADVMVVLVIATGLRNPVPGISIEQYCRNESIPLLGTGKIHTDNVIKRIKDVRPDFIFNVNSLNIIKEDILSIPKQGVINFHRGPLPSYKGVNVCSWAIINGEKEHGVTFHYVDKGIDTGDIIAQSFFEISPTETAATLTMKCLREGVRLFKKAFPLLVEGAVKGIKQESSTAKYYSFRDIPNGGYVDFNWPYEQFDRFIRGLDFHPMKNDFVHPKALYNSKEFYITKTVKVEEKPDIKNTGQIIGIDNKRIDVSLQDATIGIIRILDENKTAIEIRDFIMNYKIKKGRFFKSRKT